MTLLFLHGAGFTGACFERQIAALGDAYAPNLPGHCEPGEPASIAEFASAVVSYAEQKSITDVALCGHSMGAAIALQIALDHLLPVKALILIGAGARLRVAPSLLNGLREDFAAAAADLATHFFDSPDPKLVEWASASLLTVGSAQTLRDFQACDAFDVLERLPELAVPLLAITGESDRLTPPKYAQTFVDRVPGAQARIIPGAGHFVMVERPVETNEAIRAFLSGIA